MHRLRLSGRQDLNTKIRVYRVTAEAAGFAGFTGFVSSHAEKGNDPLDMEGGGDNSANPATSPARTDPDIANPDLWA